MRKIEYFAIRYNGECFFANVDSLLCTMTLNCHLMIMLGTNGTKNVELDNSDNCKRILICWN